MWIVPFVLLALSFQDELPPPRVPTLAVTSGKFAPLQASTDKAAGIDLASIKRRSDGHITADAYFYNEEPNVAPVAGVTYSGTLSSHMTKASIVVDCSARLVSIIQWVHLTDLGYSVSEVPSELEPLVPDPFSAWGRLLNAACSSVEQASLPVVDSYVIFHQRLEAMRNNLSLHNMASQRPR